MTKNLPGKRVLIAEDNPLLAYDMDDLLHDAGALSVGPALDLESGIRLARSHSLDAALLGINLAQDPVWPLADLLLEKNIPVVLISSMCGYEELPEAYRDLACIEKPALSRNILSTLATAMPA